MILRACFFDRPSGSPTNLITASEGAVAAPHGSPVEMGDAATSIVDRLITPSGCLAKATGVIRPAFIPPWETRNPKTGRHGSKDRLHDRSALLDCVVARSEDNWRSRL